MVVVSMLLSFSASRAPAQQSLGGLRGRVSDPSGAAVAGASVRVSFGPYERTFSSSNEGEFLFAGLPPGTWTVEVTHAGFQPWRSAAEVRVNSTKWLEVSLQVAPADPERLEVTAEGGSALNYFDATVGNHLQAERIVQLPLEGRNVPALLSLQPGVAYLRDVNIIYRNNVGDPDADPRNGAVNGGRSDQANLTLDGVDNNDPQMGLAFQGVLRVPLEGVQEFRVITTGAGAELGRSSGAQIALVSRSGEAQFHGTLFHSHRNTVTSANSWFNNRIGAPRPKLLRNVFGASVGGPVLPSRLHFFAAYEGRRDASEATVLRNVPTEAFRNGAVRYLTTGGEVRTISPEQLRAIDPRGVGPNPAALDLLRRFPLPNDRSTIDPLNFGGFRFNSPVRDSMNSALARLDARWTDSQNLWLRASAQNDRGEAALQLPATPPPILTRDTSKGVVAGWNSIWNPRWTQTVRYGLTRLALDEIGTSTGPQFSFGGGIGAPIPFTYSRGRRTPIHNLTGDWAWQPGGRHLVQFGANLRWIGNNRYNFEANRTLMVTQQARLANLGYEILPADVAAANRNDFVRAAIVVMGVVSQGNAAYNYTSDGRLIPEGEPVRRRYRTTEAEIFFQDGWRIRPNVQVNLGARYSLYSPLVETQGLQVNTHIPVGEWFELRRANAAVGLPASAAPSLTYLLAGARHGRPGFYEWDRNNLAPRVSVAWSPGTKAGGLRWLTGGPMNSVIRAGLTTYFDRVGTASAAYYEAVGSFGLGSILVTPAGQFSIATAPRLTAINVVPAGLLPPAPPFRFPSSYPKPAPGQVGAIVAAPDIHLRTPYAIAPVVSWQRQLPGRLVLDTAYVGRFGYKQLALFDAAAPINWRDPQTGIELFDAVNTLIALGPTAFSSVRESAFWDNLFPGFAVSAGDLARLYPQFARWNPGVDPARRLTPTQTAYFLFGQLHPTNPVRGALPAVDIQCRPACSRFGPYALFHDQFSSLFSWRSLGKSDYHALQVSLRGAWRSSLQFDVNYTLAQSMDWTSGVERTDPFGRANLINSWNPAQMRGPSDYDLRHNANAHWVWTLPFGRNRRIWSSAGGAANALLGGWQLAGIFRVSSGFPATVLNGYGYATSYYFQGFATLTGSLPKTGRNKEGTQAPNLFDDPAAAARSFGPTLMGQTGTRNNVRGDGLLALDLGLGKRFALPGSERHELALRWELFNAFNAVRFDTRSLALVAGTGGPFGQYSSLLVAPRAMQFLLRYAF
jgi:hypothetical protein